MEKIMVYNNDFALADALDKIQDSIKEVNEELTPALALIGMNLTEATLQDCLQGAEKTKQIFTSALAKDLKRMASEPLKKEMAERGSAAWNKFMLTCEGICRHLKYKQHLSIENGVCVLTDENRKKLSETFKVYITDPDMINVYRAHAKACDALNEMFNGKLPLHWWTVFQLQETLGKETLIMNPYTNYLRLAGKEEQL